MSGADYPMQPSHPPGSFTSVPPPKEPELRRTAPAEDSGGHWLIGRYWLFAWTVLALASPLLALWGHSADLWGVAAFVLLTGGGWLLARTHEQLATYAHLTLLIPYWSWYSQLEDGLPARIGAGVGEYVVMMMFPILVLTTIGRARVVLLAVTLATAGVLWRWEALDDRAVGLFLIATGITTGLVFRRLARQYQNAVQAMRHMAYHDPLTGLPNRREVQEWIRTALFADRGALLYLDLDRFKTINDVMGHGAGDLVLLEVVRRLREQVGDEQLLARVGGDEFVLGARGGADETELVAQAERMLGSITEPIEVGGRVVHVGGSIGIALWPEHGQTLDMLLHSADAAMYRAKQNGGGVEVAERVSQTVLRNLKNLEVELWEATKRRELTIVYQPVLKLATQRIEGAEALIRWNHSTLGAVSPAEFIPLAEETGHIVEIDCWVAERVVAQLHSWTQTGYSGWIALNVSARSIGDARWMRTIVDLVRANPSVKGRLVLEITESATMRDPERVLARIGELRDLGLHIAIDDFGMGYSSLGYLRRFRATHLKLDRCFIEGIGQHERDEELIELVLQLAARWDLDVVAEGVETNAQELWLRDRGCTFAQGFGIARPMPAEDVRRSFHSMRAPAKLA